MTIRSMIEVAIDQFYIVCESGQINRIMEQNKDWMEQYRSLLNEEGTVEENQLLKGCYDCSTTITLDTEMCFMEEWLKDNHGRPLLIIGAQSTGKKTLLCQFLNKIQRTNRYLQFIEFGSITPLYSEILYRLMVALRTHFNICQKVELNEEKLRRYFKYWLQITSNLIEKKYVGYPSNEKRQIIIIIEGIDLLTDSKEGSVSPQFWLPETIPSNVKLILSSTSPQPNLMHRVNSLQFFLSNQRLQRIISTLEPRVASLAQKLSLLELKTLQTMIKVHPHFHFKSNAFKQILQEYINDAENHFLNKEIIKSLLLLLILTKKGLTAKVLSKIVEISIQELQYFFERFSPLLRKDKGYYLICEKKIRQMIIEIVQGSKEKQKAYHEVISNMLKKEAISGRNLEEQVHHLEASQNYNELKEQICKIEHFIVLYTPGLKNILCRSWVRLEQLEQYDPVFEYNKAVEAFAGYYYPKEEDLYRIIFQICMFFKEYSEFQNPRTPAFRHPAVKGDAFFLNSINIYEELKLMNMLGFSRSHKTPRQPQPLSETSMSKRESICGGDKPLEDIQSQIKTTVQPLRQPSCETQSLNLTIASKQALFRDSYLTSMQTYLKEYFKPMQKSITAEKDGLLEAEDSDLEDQDSVLGLEAVRSSLVLKEYGAYLEEDYHKSGEQQKYYHYKQWLWVQFPWLCQSIRHNYSKNIHQCITSPTQYMSAEKEFSLIKKVLKLTQLAKDSKANIYQTKEIQLIPIKKILDKQNTIFINKLITNDDKETQLALKKSIKKVSRNPIVKQNESRESEIKNNQGICKYQFNINNIDKELYKQEEFSQKFKKRHLEQLKLKKSELPQRLNFSREQHNIQSQLVFVTEGCHLPRLNHCKTSKVSSVSKQLTAFLNGKEEGKLIRKHDTLKHQNKILISKISQLQKTMTLLESKSNFEELQKLKQMLQNSERRKANTEKQLKNQQQLKEKLETIIKITEINQMHGSESQSLAGFLASLKYMIDIQTSKIKKTEEDTIKELDAKKSTLKILKAKRKDLQKELKCKQKEIISFTEQLERKEQSNAKQREIALINNNEDINCLLKGKNIQKRRINYPPELLLLENICRFNYKQRQQNQIKLQIFLVNLQKKKELELRSKELDFQLKEKKQKIQGLRDKISLLKCKYEHAKDIEVRNGLIDKKKYLKDLCNRNSLLKLYLLKF